MKRLLKYVLAIIAIAAMFLAVRWFYSSIQDQTYESPAVPVQVEKPEVRTISESYSVTGYIEAESMVPAVPFVQGTIMEYSVENGMEVRKDQVLAVIDTEPYELQLKQAEAAYLAYEATFERISSLYKKGGATQQNYDEVKAQRDAGKAQYDLASLQLGYCYVKSPVDGTVLMSNGSVGSIAVSDTPIAVIADLEDNRDGLRIEVIRKTNGEEERAEAELVSVSPYIDPTTKSFSMKVRLTGDVSRFRPGMMVEVRIVYRSSDVYALRQSVKKLDGSIYAIREDEGITKAWYLEMERMLEDDEYFQVDDRYKDTFFIVRGQNKVLDNQPVSVTEGF